MGRGSGQKPWKPWKKETQQWCSNDFAQVDQDAGKVTERLAGRHISASFASKKKHATALERIQNELVEAKQKQSTARELLTQATVGPALQPAPAARMETDPDWKQLIEGTQEPQKRSRRQTTYNSR